MTFWDWMVGRFDEVKQVGSTSPVPASGNPTPGYRHLFDAWWFAHATVGVGLAILVAKPIAEVAAAILLPLGAAVIGLTFAWASNAQALLQTPEIQKVAAQYRGGINSLACIYQLAILVILTTMALWSIAGTGVFHVVEVPVQKLLSESFLDWVVNSVPVVFKAILYGMISLCFREAWSVVDSFRRLLVIKLDMAKAIADAAILAANNEKKANLAVLQPVTDPLLLHR